MTPANHYARLSGETDSARRFGWVSAESQHAHHVALFQAIDERLPLAGLSVRDVGCGHGAAVPWLASRGIGRYVGVDLLPDAVAAARQAHPGRTFIVRDVLDPGLQAVDVTIAVGTLGYYSPRDAERLVRRMVTTSRVGCAFTAWFEHEDAVRAAIAPWTAWRAARVEAQTTYWIVHTGGHR